MNTNYFNDYSYLDEVRIKDGIDKCKALFHETYKRDRRKAIDLLNDRRLSFPCLFVLLPQIGLLHLNHQLNLRNTAAVRIAQQITRPQDSKGGIDSLSSKNDTAYSTLKWIVMTGYTEDSSNDEYERILDVTISVLINLYRDTSILPLVAEMIFKRNKKGRNIHDLVWAFFQVHDPYALKLLAEPIRSSDQKDIELACKLLNIEAIDGKCMASDKRKLYESYLQWLEENDPFLYFTGESMQFASRPAFCNIDLERKYMYKGVASYDKQPIAPSDDDEMKCLEAFKQLGDEDKTILSTYSYEVHNKSIKEWKEWMMSPIREQMKAAKI